MEHTIQMFSEKEAARLLSVSVAALRRWRRERRGPEFTRLERCVRYSGRSLERYLAENSSCWKKIAATANRQARREVRHAQATTHQ